MLPEVFMKNLHRVRITLKWISRRRKINMVLRVKGADLVRILKKLFMEINDFEWSRLYLHANRTQNFKRIFLETMFSKSVITVTWERLDRSVWNFSHLFYT